MASRRLAAIALALFFSAVHAPAEASSSRLPGFLDADTNNDGWLTFGEAGFVFRGLTLAEFHSADSDGNGSLNEGEYLALGRAVAQRGF